MENVRRNAITLAMIGAFLLAIGVAPLVGAVRRGLSDPTICTFCDGTLVTYAREVFLEIDYVGVVPTVFAWAGLLSFVLLVLIWAGLFKQTMAEQPDRDPDGR